MRIARLKLDPEKSAAFYHLIGRVVGGEWLLGEAEREVLRKHIWRVAERLGIEVVTYAVMSNHFHVVAYAPKREILPDQELLRRYRLLRSGDQPWEESLLSEVEATLRANGPAAAEWREQQHRKMSDISEYMKLLKQRFSIWYNTAHNRFGTFWAERYKSALLEAGEAVRNCVRYVDLNPFRGGLCRDPKDYRFCGYAEAAAGNKRARDGLSRGLGSGAGWADIHRWYRPMLLRVTALHGEDDRTTTTSAIPPAAPNDRQAWSWTEAVRCRCRYFTDGAVLGTKEFVREQISLYRLKTGKGSRTEPREAGEAGSGLVVMRRLRLAAPAG